MNNLLIKNSIYDILNLKFLNKETLIEINKLSSEDR
jgi:hypothetical protein